MKCKKCKMPISNRGLDRCYCEPEGSIEALLSGPPVKISCGFAVEPLLKIKIKERFTIRGKSNGVQLAIAKNIYVGANTIITPAVAETFTNKVPVGADFDDDLKGHADGTDEHGRIFEWKTCLEAKFDPDYYKQCVGEDGVFGDHDLLTAKALSAPKKKFNYKEALKEMLSHPFPKEIMWMHPDTWKMLVEEPTGFTEGEVADLGVDKMHPDTEMSLNLAAMQCPGPLPELNFGGAIIKAGSNKYSFEERCKKSGITVDPVTRERFKGTQEEYEEYFSGVMDTFEVPKYYRPIPIDEIVATQQMTAPMRRFTLNFSLKKDQDKDD